NRPRADGDIELLVGVLQACSPRVRGRAVRLHRSKHQFAGVAYLPVEGKVDFVESGNAAELLLLKVHEASRFRELGARLGLLKFEIEILAGEVDRREPGGIELALETDEGKIEVTVL